MRWFPFLLALGCATPAPSAPAPQPVELRTWDLPPGYAGRLVGSLQRVLDDQGRAQEGPGGSIVVVAPEAVLDGVDGLVKRAVAGPPATPARNVELAYWVVRGVPATEPSRGAGLDVLDTVLDTIQATDGPMALTLLANRSLRTLDGDRATLEDETVQITHTIGVEPGTNTIVADVKIGVPRAAEVQTRLSLESGTIAVLSQAGFPSDEGNASLYLLVRPTLVE